MIGSGFLARYAALAMDQEFLRIISEFVPAHFNWPLFALGEILMIVLPATAFSSSRTTLDSER